MYNQFELFPAWNEIQKKAYNSQPNTIISGGPGSGKTLLACNIAMREAINNKVAILVFTKALRTFIRDYFNLSGISNIEVLYERQWKKLNLPCFDILIIDEFQDFSKNDIQKVLNNSEKGVYLFGDSEQKLYYQNFEKEPTINIDELIELTGFKNISLPDNFRIPEINRLFIKNVFPDKSILNSNNRGNYKPHIYHFDNTQAELIWIKDFLRSNTQLKNVGIFLKRNDSIEGEYYYRQKLRTDKIYGIKHVYDYLTSNGISCSYKNDSDDKLDFTKDVKINIMTYHSSKGLQFDCVILPFSTFVNDNFGNLNLPYVALTRSENLIIITHSGSIANEYSGEISLGSFNGNIIRQSSDDDPTPAQFLQDGISAIRSNLDY